MSGRSADAFADFVESYTEDLAQFGCTARVAMPKVAWHRGSLEILDAQGYHLAYVPRSVEPIETAAFMVMLQKHGDRPRSR